MSLLFNLDKKNQTSTKAVEGVHYKLLKDGHGVEHRILNLENEELCPRFGIVELEPLKTSNRHRHQNNISFRVIRDKEFDVLVGIPLGIDPKTKNIIWQKINVIEGEVLDLSIPANAMRWAVIKRSHFFVDSPNYHQGTKAAYNAVDKEREAEVFNLERRVKRKAVDIAEALFGEELMDYGRNCGYDPKSMSANTLSMEVIKFAEKNPDKFMEIHNSDTRIELTVLNRGLQMGVLNQHLENGINYNGLTLGFNIPEALKYLKDHPATLTSIDALSKQTDIGSDISMEVKPRVSLDSEEASLMIAKLQKELATKERALLAATEKALELQASADIGNIDSEFAELLAEAKQLDVKGAHMIKNKDKLKEKIADKKALTKN